jgi:hypothetical protein
MGAWNGPGLSVVGKRRDDERQRAAEWFVAQEKGPQVERELVIRLEKILEFNHAPHNENEY